MSRLDQFAESEEHALLTMREAFEVLRVGRSMGYKMAHQYLSSGGNCRTAGAQVR